MFTHLNMQTSTKDSHVKSAQHWGGGGEKKMKKMTRNDNQRRLAVMGNHNIRFVCVCFEWQRKDSTSKCV